MEDIKISGMKLNHIFASNPFEYCYNEMCEHMSKFIENIEGYLLDSIEYTVELTECYIKDNGIMDYRFSDNHNYNYIYSFIYRVIAPNISDRKYTIKMFVDSEGIITPLMSD